MIKLSRSSKASPIRLGLALTCAVSALAACSQGGGASNTAANAEGDNTLADALPPATALPLTTGPAPAYRPAPPVNALPPAPSAPLGRVPPSDEYAYLNQAYAFSQSLADAPPDYSYDYQGEAPWVWQSPDGYYRVAERLPMGVRYFYYAPGASEPYLIQDPQYSYGYSEGRLAVVYGPDGRVLPYDDEVRQARAAGAYLAWAAGLYAAARHQDHVAVAQERWNAERQAVYADQARWRDAQARNAAWASYAQAHQNDQAHWADQRYARAAEAARFAETVHDQAALAHAQQAAAEARAIAQSPGAKTLGPPSQGEGQRHEPGAEAPISPAPAAVNRAAVPPAGGQDRRDRPPEPPPQPGSERRPPAAPAARAPAPAAADVAAVERQQAMQREHAAPPAGGPPQARERAPTPAHPAAPVERPAVPSHQTTAESYVVQTHSRQTPVARPVEAAAPAGRAPPDRPQAEAHRPSAPDARPENRPQAGDPHRAPPAPAAHPAAKPEPEPKDKPRPDPRSA